MSKENDGGPAYPQPEINGDPVNSWTRGCGGLSARDWFAGQALAVCIELADAFNDECRERGSSTRIEADATAITCYQYADGMLKARAQ